MMKFQLFSNKNILSLKIQLCLSDIWVILFPLNKVRTRKKKNLRCQFNYLIRRIRFLIFVKYQRNFNRSQCRLPFYRSEFMHGSFGLYWWICLRLSAFSGYKIEWLIKSSLLLAIIYWLLSGRLYLCQFICFREHSW